MLSALKTGDKVVTNGGLYGTIVGMDGEAVQLARLPTKSK